MHRAWLLAFVLVVPFASGCLGSVEAAEIPDPEQEGWSQTSQDEESMAFGLAQVVTLEYEPNTGAGTTGVIVASTTNVPVFDEERLLPMALEQVENERGIDLRQDGETTLTLANLDGVEVVADRYAFEKDGVEGKAVLFTVDRCDPFVVVVGYGVTDPAGMFADPTYDEAREMASTVTC